MKIKKDVSLFGLQPEMVAGLGVIVSTYHGVGFECVITSGTEPKAPHKRTSLHWVGLALDFRIRHIPDFILPNLIKNLKNNLGPEFYVRPEKTHIHVAFKPHNG